MNLDAIAIKHGTDKSSTYHAYCGIYEQYLEPLRKRQIQLLEIGVQYGYSIRTWLEYFPNGTIYGMDIGQEFECNDPRYIFWKVNQTDGGEIDGKLQDPAIAFDVVIDDGCHIADAQAVSFDHIWHKLRTGGIYVIEDSFTWNDPDFKGELNGYKWLAERISDLNQNGKAFYGKPHPAENPTYSHFELTVKYIHCYRGLVIIGKK